MTDRVKKRIVKYAVICGSILAILLVFFGLSYAGSITRRTYVLQAANVVCSAAPVLQQHEVTITGIFSGKPQGLLFRDCLTAEYDEKPARVFLLPRAGRYGMYTGVFLYEQSTGCIFCGLIGKGVYSDVSYCGISPAALAVQQKKIENVMTGAAP